MFLSHAIKYIAVLVVVRLYVVFPDINGFEPVINNPNI